MKLWRELWSGAGAYSDLQLGVGLPAVHGPVWTTIPTEWALPSYKVPRLPGAGLGPSRAGGARWAMQALRLSRRRQHASHQIWQKSTPTAATLPSADLRPWQRRINVRPRRRGAEAMMAWRDQASEGSSRFNLRASRSSQRQGKHLAEPGAASLRVVLVSWEWSVGWLGAEGRRRMGARARPSPVLLRRFTAPSSRPTRWGFSRFSFWPCGVAAKGVRRHAGQWWSRPVSPQSAGTIDSPLPQTDDGLVVAHGRMSVVHPSPPDAPSAARSGCCWTSGPP